MKIRRGFVSNSSSSSFLVGFKKKPATKEELHKVLFGTTETHTVQPYKFVKAFDSGDLAGRIFDDLCVQEPLTEAQAEEEFSSGYFPGYPEHDFGTTYDEIERQVSAAASRKWPQIWAKLTRDGAGVYTFSYSDNAGDMETTLEHGDLFARLPHVVISHH
jgi:hypothetical protein